MSFAVAVDIGGTFTDLVAFDPVTKDVVYAKSPTTYGNFVEGILDCFEHAGLAPADSRLLNHGTTLVINALIQRQGAKTALVTTKGFRDVLEIARANRPDPFDLYYRRDEPLIPRDLRFEVNERIGAGGEVIAPLDIRALAELARHIGTLGVEAVAVFFMNSYLDPRHEIEAARILKERLPGIYVTYSTELKATWRRAASVARCS
jgi:N-methylhydantoinase A